MANACRRDSPVSSGRRISFPISYAELPDHKVANHISKNEKWQFRKKWHLELI